MSTKNTNRIPYSDNRKKQNLERVILRETKDADLSVPFLKPKELYEGRTVVN